MTGEFTWQMNLQEAFPWRTLFRLRATSNVKLLSRKSLRELSFYTKRWYELLAKTDIRRFGNFSGGWLCACNLRAPTLWQSSHSCYPNFVFFIFTRIPQDIVMLGWHVSILCYDHAVCYLHKTAFSFFFRFNPKNLCIVVDGRSTSERVRYYSISQKEIWGLALFFFFFLRLACPTSPIGAPVPFVFAGVVANISRACIFVQAIASPPLLEV